MKRKAGRARNGKGSGAKARAEEQLAAMRLESERVERAQDAEWLALPIAERMDFLRVRLPNGGECL